MQEYEGNRSVEDLSQYLRNIAAYRMPQLLRTEADAKAASASGRLVLGLFRQPIAASSAFKTFSTTVWELARSAHPIAAAYSASYATPPFLPLTVDGKTPPVPSLVLLDAEAKLATHVLPLPRKREDFNTKKASSAAVPLAPRSSLAPRELDARRSWSGCNQLGSL